jgi:hypothetical protein
LPNGIQFFLRLSDPRGVDLGTISAWNAQPVTEGETALQ